MAPFGLYHVINLCRYEILALRWNLVDQSFEELKRGCLFYFLFFFVCGWRPYGNMRSKTRAYEATHPSFPAESARVS